MAASCSLPVEAAVAAALRRPVSPASSASWVGAVAVRVAAPLVVVGVVPTAAPKMPGARALAAVVVAVVCFSTVGRVMDCRQELPVVSPVVVPRGARSPDRVLEEVAVVGEGILVAPAAGA
jgi:hypothetical protein